MRQLARDRVAAVLTAIIALAAFATAPASATHAKVTRTDHVTATVKRAKSKGSTLVYKGTATSSLFGRGKVVEHARIKGLGSVGRVTITYKHGTVRATTTSKGSLHANLTVSFTGTYKITGGSGAYRHISGHGSFTGKGPLDLSRATFKQRGRVSY